MFCKIKSVLLLSKTNYDIHETFRFRFNYKHEFVDVNTSTTGTILKYILNDRSINYIQFYKSFQKKKAERYYINL